MMLYPGQPLRQGMSCACSRSDRYGLHNFSLRSPLRARFLHMIERAQLIVREQTDAKSNQLLRLLVQLSLTEAYARKMVISLCHLRHALLQIVNFILVSCYFVIDHVQASNHTFSE